MLILTWSIPYNLNAANRTTHHAVVWSDSDSLSEIIRLNRYMITEYTHEQHAHVWHDAARSPNFANFRRLQKKLYNERINSVNIPEQQSICDRLDNMIENRGMISCHHCGRLMLATQTICHTCETIIL